MSKKLLSEDRGVHIEKDILNAVAERPMSAAEVAERVPYAGAGELAGHLEALVWIGYLEHPTETTYRLGREVWPWK